MKPVIKWSGGKSQEIKFFEHKYPKNFKRYVEPFTGGGGVYFDMQHPNSIINDINFELISLYQIIHSVKNRNEFIKQLEIINEQRNIFNSYSLDLNIKQLTKIFDTRKEENLNLNKRIIYSIKDKKLNDFATKSIKDKVVRIRAIEKKENKKFQEVELKDHLTTALQSALYFYNRKIYNDGFDESKINLNNYIASWYYVREFCYSSMFRFSKNGNFNVPYGGIGYNSKDFALKINRLKNDKELHNLLKNTQINKLDFEKLFEKYEYFNEDDFIFLDPPYDSEFSQYNKEGDFDKKEQIRLRDVLLKTKAKIMVVIKETDFINELYVPYFKIEKFDKKYMTNMRNRNNKDVQHLIITNY